MQVISVGGGIIRKLDVDISVFVLDAGTGIIQPVGKKRAAVLIDCEVVSRRFIYQDITLVVSDVELFCLYRAQRKITAGGVEGQVISGVRLDGQIPIFVLELCAVCVQGFRRKVAA